MIVDNKFYIFLDIDGVLATSNQYYTNPKKWHEEYSCYRFDKKCVNVFNSILKKVKDKNKIFIILTSDWKTSYSIEAMNRIFKWNELNGAINDYTSTLWGIQFTRMEQLDECRAKEILLYVRERQIKNWLAIDDLDLSPWIDETHFVRTPRANEGIKQSGIKDKILNIILNQKQ